MLEYLPIIAGILIAQMSPGPNLLAVSSFALGTSRRAGLLTSAGVATGVLVWAVLFAFGVGAFLHAFPEALVAMKLIGGTYLVYLAFRSLLSVYRSRPDQASRPSTESPNRRAYLTGLLVVLTNPKAALMWVAITMFFAASNPLPAHYLLVGIGASLSALIIYGSYAVLFSTGVAVRTYSRFHRMIETAFGLVFGALGGRLLFDGLRELR